MTSPTDTSPEPVRGPLGYAGSPAEAEARRLRRNAQRRAQRRWAQSVVDAVRAQQHDFDDAS